MSDFPMLFEPRRMGKLHLPNRIVFPPLATHMATKEVYSANDSFTQKEILHFYQPDIIS